METKPGDLEGLAQSTAHALDTETKEPEKTEKKDAPTPIASNPAPPAADAPVTKAPVTEAPVADAPDPDEDDLDDLDGE